jgi:L-fuconolactonase
MDGRRLSRRRVLGGAVGLGAGVAGASLLGVGGALAARSVRGRLAAGAAGHFATYTFEYPGDESVYTIALQVFPDETRVLENAGFKVFGPQPGRVYVTGGAQRGLRPNVSGNLIGKERGSYTVEISNYDPAVAIEYELTIGRRRPESQQVEGELATPVDIGGAAASDEMVIVDAHTHATPVWYERVESVLHMIDLHGVRHAHLVQIGNYFDHRHQEEAVRRYPGRFANVVQVDWTQPDAVQRLEALVARGNVSGVRINSAGRTPGEDPLALWRAAGRLGLTVTSGGNVDVFSSDEFERLVAAVPETKIVIEHLGSVNTPDGEESPWPKRRRVMELGRRYPNTLVKIHGLGEFARRATPVPPNGETFPFQRPIPPFLEWAYDNFGPTRMMWGSDYGLVSSREGYRFGLELPMAELASKSEADRRAIFGATALAHFKIVG